MAKYTEDDLRVDLENKQYEYGFVTDIEYDDFPTGLSEEIIRMISEKKEEPEWMTDWRLEAFRIWQKMEEPDWANVNYEKVDFQAIRYYAAPKKKPELASLDEVDPELLKTFEKLGINIEELFSVLSPRRSGIIPNWCANTSEKWCRVAIISMLR